jgi:nucleoside-diphosphate-sugar epimerase
MKAFITGATGFIGGILAEALVSAGWSVRVLVRPGSFTRLAHPENYEGVEGDLSDIESLRPILIRPDEVVVHAGGIRNRWGTPPNSYYTVNVEATRRLLYNSLGKAKRFVYVSSVGVFGHPGVLDIGENFPTRKTRGEWDYHSTKLEGENVVLGRKSEVEAVIVRPTITYGPGDTDGMVTRLIEMVAHRRFTRIGSAQNHIHLTFITDIIRGLVLAMTHPNAPGGTFVLAGPEPIVMNDLLGLVTARLGASLPPFGIPEGIARFAGWNCENIYRLLPRTFTPPITRDKVDNLCLNRGFSTAKATHELGYTPRIPYVIGVDRTVEWMISTGRLKPPKSK